MLICPVNLNIEWERNEKSNFKSELKIVESEMDICAPNTLGLQVKNTGHEMCVDGASDLLIRDVEKNQNEGTVVHTGYGEKRGGVEGDLGKPFQGRGFKIILSLKSIKLS